MLLNVPQNTAQNLRLKRAHEISRSLEQLNNAGFNPVEFDGIKMQAGLNSFTLTPKQWIESTGAIGLVSKAGRYGGTSMMRLQNCCGKPAPPHIEASTLYHGGDLLERRAHDH